MLCTKSHLSAEENRKKCTKSKEDMYLAAIRLKFTIIIILY